jgi:DNA-binding GntR family transcriptional regulator
VLRSRILEHGFRPGERIFVDRLADQLGISRTPIKDALRRLENDGLVEVGGRKGFRVISFRWRDIEETLDLRLAFELHAARTLARIVTDIDIAHLNQMIDSSRRCMESGTTSDYEAFVDLDRDFHLYLIDRAGNPRLGSAYRALHAHMQIAYVYHRESRLVGSTVPDEHLEIVQALSTHDLQPLQAAIETHIANVVSRFQARKGSPDG